MATPNADGFGSDFKDVQPSLNGNIEAASSSLHKTLFPRNITTETWCVPDYDFTSTLKKVENMIETKWGSVLSMSLDDNPARYAAISKAIREVCPPLRLIWWRTLEHCGRAPRSNEGYSLSLEEAAAICRATGKVFTYYFLSHRWETREHLDPTGHKAKICSAYGRERTQTFNEEVFFWIDYTCIDQEGMAPFIASLPLYCSAAQVLMVPFHKEYEERGWCLVERLAYAALNCPLQFICGQEYVKWAKERNWLQQQSCFTYHVDSDGRHFSWLRPLADPRDGKLGFEKDRPVIKDLTQVLIKHWGKSWVNGSKWPPKGAYEMCSTTGWKPVQWGKTTVNAVLISFL